MEPNQELYLCQAIEIGLCDEYLQTPELNDALCIIALDNAIIALKQKYGFAKNETVISRPAIDRVISHVVNTGLDNIGKTGDLTLKEYIAVVNKIKRSVARHSVFGPRAYGDFIKNYV
ncbi:MAG: hypothetical protein V4857_10610 [Pseudomonadota bacterium]